MAYAHERDIVRSVPVTTLKCESQLKNLRFAKHFSNYVSKDFVVEFIILWCFENIFQSK